MAYPERSEGSREILRAGACSEDKILRPGACPQSQRSFAPSGLRMTGEGGLRMTSEGATQLICAAEDEGNRQSSRGGGS
ncbi:MAG: hypothetical protein A3G87_10030 [Omnitrophica bacterium RIFCSPLOWO2_12_FULL_50_11]|nr:MAG: hypothetical protein A3G87_10030 [Omnitrophica bacterium RIFCSPLOWO2_12_FULL_50_11]